MKKFVVRLRVKELMKAQIDKDIASDKELADLLNVNVTQIWRIKLPVEDPRNNVPGNQFIAGVMEIFGGRFDEYFYIEEVDDPRKTKQKPEKVTV
ncbi:hypothetical protein [Paenibacillus xylanexedens]|uniref:HTH cro/C1-type domain-containing protein n=1 Tax=Paenibacillus xylanexedens TaxID=528191 RepID=A0ABS4RSR3_PAEXY|nr:hypothetical protein [Paenibacillus xylanexedens]MBP2245339.1 hypothetical protein [Paenibacillus xylanexedens]